MKTDHIFKYLAATIIVGVALALVQPAHAAEGKERTKKRSGTYETSEGKSGTAEGTVTRSKGKKTREGSVTNQDGETATRKSERLRDKETGTDTYSSTTTAPGGKTATTNSTLTKTGEGTASTTGTRTGFNGQTSTYAGTVAKTEDGRTAAGMVTGPDGKTAAVNTTATHRAGEANKTTTLTGQDGLTAERIIATRKNPDGTVTRTIQVTKPNGTTSTRSETVTVTADGKN
jgi:hypothetical protein